MQRKGRLGETAFILVVKVKHDFVLLGKIDKNIYFAKFSFDRFDIYS
jgi:hypothetical protein